MWGLNSQLPSVVSPRNKIDLQSVVQSAQNKEKPVEASRVYGAHRTWEGPGDMTTKSPTLPLAKLSPGELYQSSPASRASKTPLVPPLDCSRSADCPLSPHTERRGIKNLALLTKFSNFCFHSDCLDSKIFPVNLLCVEHAERSEECQVPPSRMCSPYKVVRHMRK